MRLVVCLEEERHEELVDLSTLKTNALVAIAWGDVGMRELGAVQRRAGGQPFAFVASP